MYCGWSSCPVLVEVCGGRAWYLGILWDQGSTRMVYIFIWLRFKHEDSEGQTPWFQTLVIFYWLNLCFHFWCCGCRRSCFVGQAHFVRYGPKVKPAFTFIVSMNDEAIEVENLEVKQMKGCNVTQRKGNGIQREYPGTNGDLVDKRNYSSSFSEGLNRRPEEMISCTSTNISTMDSRWSRHRRIKLTLLYHKNSLKGWTRSLWLLLSP